ncbi:MAG: UPF0182 family protein [Clostridia bacterium]|nr:UPF0182 family protein [Clostridia bacterium]
MRLILRHGLIPVLAVLIVIVTLVSFASNLYADILWFKAMEYVSVLYIMVLSNLSIRLVSFLFLFAFFFINLLITRRFIKIEKTNISYDHDNVIPIRESFFKKYLNHKRILQIFLLSSMVLAFMLSSITAGQWLTVQSYLNATAFEIADPIFNKDISFYVFTLPFYKLLYALLVSAVIGSAVLVGFVYFLFTPKDQFNFKLANFKQPHVHLSILIAIFFILKAWDYRLRVYELLLSKRGAVFGAGYTDVAVQLPAYNILAIIALVLAVLIFASIFFKVYKLIMGSVVLLVISSILLGAVIPNSVQRFMVEPNEFSREAPYLEREIAFTRTAYNLERIDIKPFQVTGDLNWQDIKNNASTIDNIRLWDYRPLRSSFEQLQTLRLYYEFNDVDVDRYWIDGQYRQVMLSARELDQSQLQPQAQTWINQRLRYTHGFSVVMSAVNETTSEGLPRLLIRDIPAQSISQDIRITEPSIYFGELTTNPVIVKTNTKEFHYPSGNENVETIYEGTGGVPIDSLIKRIFFALYNGDFRLLLTGELTNESRILYNRDINTIVEKIAPFLTLDKDPYIVINDGRLFWIRDAYTVTNMYPYSQPFRGLNYIRNSVKIVTDAYNGTTIFYIADDTDPIIETYSKVFPELFQPLSSMPDGLQNHIRYPVELFNVQASMLTLYQMQNPQVFYNREDAWSIPREIIRGESQVMEPYYTIMQLPGEEEPEFILLLPFTPLNRSNMVSWLAARNDGENYGNLILYQFPKDSHIFGPMQIEARIDQDAEISQQLSLWDQAGSQVLRGNLLVIPIENSLLYVEPIFLQAEQSRIPELRRVIVAFGDRIVMEETLEKSLTKLFYRDFVDFEEAPGEDRVPSEEPLDPSDGAGLTMSQLINQANRLFREAQEFRQEGDWAGYGRALEEFEKVLKQLADISQE